MTSISEPCLPGLGAGPRRWKGVVAGSAVVAASGGLVAAVTWGFGGLNLVLVLASALVVGAIVVVSGLPGAPARLELGPQLFVFLLFSNAIVLASTRYGVPSSVMALSYVFLAIPAVMYVAVERRPVIITLALPTILIYASTQFLAGAFARDIEATVPPLLNFLSEGLVLYLLLSNVVRSSVALRRLTWVLIAAAVFMSSLSVWQEVTGTYDNDYGGFAEVNEEAFKVGEDVDGKVMRDRAGGPLGSPNRFAQILLMALPFAIVQAVGSHSRRLRLAAGGAVLLILAAILVTFSRGALIGFAAVLAVALMRKVLRPRQVAICAIGAVLVLFVAVPDYLIRVYSFRGVEGLVTEEGPDPDGAMLGRVSSNIAAVRIFADHPLVGVGPLQYFQRYSEEAGNDVGLRHRDGRRRGHNLYLEKLADTGALGLLAFLAIPAVTVWQLWQLGGFWRERRRDLALLTEAFVLSIVAYYSTGIFLHLSYERYFWMLLALANAAIWVVQRERVVYLDHHAGPENIQVEA